MNNQRSNVVLINIGLAVGDDVPTERGAIFSRANAFHAVATYQLARHGFAPSGWVVKQSSTEPTLVAQYEGNSSFNAAGLRIALSTLCEVLEQEDIAYLYNGAGGMATGAWGAFDAALFLLIAD